MRIGIIGAGQIGGTLTRRWSELGHDVAVANSRGPESLAELATATGATPVEVREAVEGRDVIVVTIPLGAVPDLPADLFAEVDPETVVIDTCNYFPDRDGRIAGVEDKGRTESQWVEAHLGRPVIKLFNTINFEVLGSAGRPAGEPGRVALPIAGEDGPAKQTACELVEELGFDPVDAGSLEESWRQHPDTPVFGADLDADRTRQGLADASPERTERFKG